MPPAGGFGYAGIVLSIHHAGYLGGMLVESLFCRIVGFLG